MNFAKNVEILDHQTAGRSSKQTSEPAYYITGATGATEVAPKFSDTLTLSQPRGADSAHHCRGRS